MLPQLAADLVAPLRERLAAGTGRLFVGLDGRSGAGKSTLTAAAARPPGIAGPRLPVAYQGLAGMPTTGLPAATVAAVFRTAAVTSLVAPLLAVFRERFRLSPQVLRGNVASALAGAVGMLAQARPAHAERAGQLLADILDQPPLAGAGTLVRPDPGRARRFLVRHNCCLYYRIPGGGTCGDCVLTPSAERERQWRSVLDADPASGSAAGTRP